MPSVLLGLALPCQAQIDLRLSVPHSRYIQYEAIEVTVEIENNSGAPLDFGGDGTSSLSFEVEQSPGRQLQAWRPIAFPDGLRLRHGERGSRSVDVSRHYDMRSMGPYGLVAKVRAGDKSYTSARSYIDIVPGLEIASLSSGDREFSLRTVHRGLGDFLLLRVNDVSKSLSLGVYDLGRLLRTYSPALRLDGAGHVHVLHQSGPNHYTHSTFSTDGTPLQRTAEYSATPAQLDDDGTGNLVMRAGETPETSDPFLEEGVNALRERRKNRP